MCLYYQVTLKLIILVMINLEWNVLLLESLNIEENWFAHDVLEECAEFLLIHLGVVNFYMLSNYLLCIIG